MASEDILASLRRMYEAESGASRPYDQREEAEGSAFSSLGSALAAGLRLPLEALELPASAFAAATRGVARFAGLPVAETSTRGDLMRSALGLGPEEAEDSYGKRLLGLGVKLTTDIGLDPATWAAAGLGQAATAGRAAEAGLAAAAREGAVLVPDALAAAGKTIQEGHRAGQALSALSAGFGAGMVPDVLEGVPHVYSKLRDEGMTPETAEELVGTALAGVGAAAGLTHAALGLRPRPAARPVPEPAPAVEAPAVIPGPPPATEIAVPRTAGLETLPPVPAEAAAVPGMETAVRRADMAARTQELLQRADAGAAGLPEGMARPAVPLAGEMVAPRVEAAPEPVTVPRALMAPEPLPPVVPSETRLATEVPPQPPELAPPLAGRVPTETLPPVPLPPPVPEAPAAIPREVEAQALREQAARTIPPEPTEPTEPTPSQLAPAFATAETPSPAKPLRVEMVKEAFGPKVEPVAVEGGFEVPIGGGRKITVRETGAIEYDPAEFAAGYGREKGAAERIVGKYQRLGPDGMIWLLKEAGAPVVHHEAFHAAMDLALKPKERLAVLKRYGSEEAAAEAYGKWEPAVRNSAFSRILGFFRRVYRSFRPSWESAFEEVRSGRAFERAPAAELPLPSYAATGGPRELSFAGYLDERGIGDPGLEHAAYGPSGQVSRGTRRAFLERREAETTEYSQAQENYRLAVDRGEIVDPTGRVKASAPSTVMAAIQEATRLRERAIELRDLADRGMKPRAYRAEADRLDAKALQVETQSRYATAPTEPASEAAPEPMGRRVRPEESPRVEMKVEDLRRIEQLGKLEPAALSREQARRWEDLDPEVRQVLKTVPDEKLYNKAVKGQLNDVEVMALDARVRDAVEQTENARLRLEQARVEGKDVGPINAEFLEAALKAQAVRAARAARTDVEAGTKLARALAARARVMEAGKSVPTDFLRKVFREIEGVTDEQAAGLLRILQEDPAKLPDALNAAIQPGLLPKWLELWKAGLVSGPGTQVANILGNIGEQGMRLLETPTAALVDRILPGERGRFVGEAGAEIGGAFSRLPDALSGLGAELKEIVSLAPERIDLTKPLEYQAGKIPGKVGRVVRIPFRLLGAFDSFFKAVGGEAELHKLAHRKAKIELPSADVKAVQERSAAIVKEALDPKSDKHADLVQQVAEARQARTFQDDPHPMIKSLMRLRNQHPWMHVILPFLQTPGKIAEITIQRSPLGFVKAARAYKAFRNAETQGIKGPELARLRGQAVDAIARPLVGTGMIAGFVTYAKMGGMTGSGPVDPAARNLLKETGWQPYSFVVPTPGGNVYVPFNRFEPVSSLLGAAADLAELKDEKKAADIFDKTLGSVASNLTSKTYLAGLSDAASMIAKPQQFASQYLSNLAGTLIPNVVAKAAQAADPVIRDVRPNQAGLLGIPERVAKTIASRVPGLSMTLSARLSGTGATVQRPGTAATRFLLPSQPSREKPGAALEQTLVRLGIVPSEPPRELTIKGRKVRLEDDERQLLAAARQATMRYLRENVVSQAWFERLPDTIEEGGDGSKEAVIRRSLDRFSDRARQMVARMPDVVRRAVAG